MKAWTKEAWLMAGRCALSLQGRCPGLKSGLSVCVGREGVDFDICSQLLILCHGFRAALRLALCAYFPQDMRKDVEQAASE